MLIFSYKGNELNGCKQCINFNSDHLLRAIPFLPWRKEADNEAVTGGRSDCWSHFRGWHWGRPASSKHQPPFFDFKSSAVTQSPVKTNFPGSLLLSETLSLHSHWWNVSGRDVQATCRLASRNLCSQSFLLMDGQKDEGGHLDSSNQALRLVLPSLDSSSPGRAMVRINNFWSKFPNLGNLLL